MNSKYKIQLKTLTQIIYSYFIYQFCMKRKVFNFKEIELELKANIYLTDLDRLQSIFSPSDPRSISAPQKY